jgi:hypothetical protein
MKGGEKDEENQADSQKDRGGKKGEPSEADQEVVRAGRNGWYPKNSKTNPKEFLGCHPRKIMIPWLPYSSRALALLTQQLRF